MLKVARAAFAVACFWGLSDVHECSGRLQMAAYPLDKQTAGCNSPQDWHYLKWREIQLAIHPIVGG